jgi:hypothetical protein
MLFHYKDLRVGCYYFYISCCNLLMLCEYTNFELVKTEANLVLCDSNGVKVNCANDNAYIIQASATRIFK